VNERMVPDQPLSNTPRTAPIIIKVPMGQEEVRRVHLDPTPKCAKVAATVQELIFPEME
jgi:hypothetical protein